MRVRVKLEGQTFEGELLQQQGNCALVQVLKGDAGIYQTWVKQEFLEAVVDLHAQPIPAGDVVPVPANLIVPEEDHVA